MNKINVSADCESLGKAFDAPIIAIGAIAFDITTGKPTSKPFYKEVELSSAIKSGRVDGSTVAWWITQSKRAKKIFETPDEKKSSLATVLVEFSQWYRVVAPGAAPWTRGLHQDVTWLEHAFTVGSHGLTIPWRYDAPRDVRTIIDLATDLFGFDESSVPEVGVAHNAVDDAVYQANVISAAYAAMRSKSTTTTKPSTPVEDPDEL